jgi:uncharacterized protein
MQNIEKLHNLVNNSWLIISPSWPLQNLIAVNPLSGLEDIKFKDALHQSKAYFKQEQIPQEILDVNREMIKWLQVFFDEGQATIKMPKINGELWKSVAELVKYDTNITKNNHHLIDLFLNNDNSPIEVIELILKYLNIAESDYELYLKMMLTTLPGWSSYVKYLADWKNQKNNLKIEYLAIRLVIVCFLYPNSVELINIFKTMINNTDNAEDYNNITDLESELDNNILQQISLDNTILDKQKKYDAQLVFCIDVRSEPMRRAIENQGSYQTFGYAGFFGLPIKILNNIKSENYDSCPVLISSKHDIKLKPNSIITKNRFQTYKFIANLYQSLKYNMVTTFTLVEAIGSIYGLKLLLRSILPNIFYKMTDFIKVKKNTYQIDSSYLDDINIDDQCNYAINCLRMIGLVENFSPLIVICGHGSTTENNPFASSLDCGACGGRKGDINAELLAQILNKKEVREFLEKNQINIPENTYFIGALHNTTTDKITFLNAKKIPAFLTEKFNKLQQSLDLATKQNLLFRDGKLQQKSNILDRAKDWSQTRPEWGLSGNAGLIIAERDFSKNINLDGRFFLHSYDWLIDKDNKILENILMAPMIVAQWINAQYLFSTMDNKIYGSGSKITSNIVGKIAVMQGNSSDLMNGLSLQSVYKNDNIKYHSPVRLLVIINAPREKILEVIVKFDILKKLLSNGWVRMVCFDPLDNKNRYRLNDGLSWIKES